MLPRALVLLSGGLDSTTTLAIALSERLRVHTLSFDYSQRHAHELRAARRISRALGAQQHHVCTIDTGVFRHSALTDRSVAVPKRRIPSQLTHNDIPATYVPARNIIFLAHALALAESLCARYIYIGATAVDYSGYPDCRAPFFHAFQRVADVGTKAGAVHGAAPQIRTPLLHLRKTQIIEKGLALGVDYAMTHSCYDPAPDGRPCTACDSCILRAEAFTQLGFDMDPLLSRFQ